MAGTGFEDQRQWRQPLNRLPLKAGAWHSFAVTLHSGTLTLYIDGDRCAVLQAPRLEPLWSEPANAGIQLGGSPWNSSRVWISDLRISRTARTPGEPVGLRPLESILRVDADTVAKDVPADFLGALHPAQRYWPDNPDQPGFWDGTVEDYLELYARAAPVVRRVDPDTPIGGQESGLQGPWVEALIQRCARDNLPLDFIWAQREARSMTVEWRSLAEGQWTLERWVVSPQHSSRLDAAATGRDPEPHDGLERVEHRTLKVSAAVPPRVTLVLPPHSSTFLSLRPASLSPCWARGMPIERWRPRRCC